jgi:hypothetical protein
MAGVECRTLERDGDELAGSQPQHREKLWPLVRHVNGG